MCTAMSCGDPGRQPRRLESMPAKKPAPNELLRASTFHVGSEIGHQTKRYCGLIQNHDDGADSRKGQNHPA